MPFVFHIDEVQAWSVPAEFKRKKQEELISEEYWPHYTFIVLTRVLNELVTLVPRFRVVLSGTDYIVGGALQFATGVGATYRHCQLFN